MSFGPIHDRIMNSAKIVQGRLENLDQKHFAIPVVAQGMLCFIRDAYDSHIVLEPLGIAEILHKNGHTFYADSEHLIDFEYSEEKAELIAILDQAIKNTPVRYEYIEIEMPQYIEVQYIVKQIKQEDSEDF